MAGCPNLPGETGRRQGPLLPFCSLGRLFWSWRPSNPNQVRAGWLPVCSQSQFLKTGVGKQCPCAIFIYFFLGLCLLSRWAHIPRSLSLPGILEILGEEGCGWGLLEAGGREEGGHLQGQRSRLLHSARAARLSPWGGGVSLQPPGCTLEFLPPEASFLLLPPAPPGFGHFWWKTLSKSSGLICFFGGGVCLVLTWRTAQPYSQICSGITAGGAVGCWD